LNLLPTLAKTWVHSVKIEQTQNTADLTSAAISEIIEMALSDHIAFQMICDQHGLTPDQVKALMRSQLKPGSYRAWRKRVRTFSDRRAHYK
jgi:uncharacterized protein (TIGR03643 family)